MSLGISAATWAGIGTIGTIAGSLFGSYQQGQAAQNAAEAQGEAAGKGIKEQRREFDKLQALLAPYVQAGGQGLSGQQDLLGLNGQQAQQAAIDAIQNGSQYQSTLKAGQNAILQNASATGGLRGGNVQSGLANFSADALNQAIMNHYNQLGGMTTLGQNSAAGVGAAGMQNAQSLANLYGQQGAAQAGGYLAQGQAAQGPVNALLSGLGVYTGLSQLPGKSVSANYSGSPVELPQSNVPFMQGGFKLG